MTRKSNVYTLLVGAVVRNQVHRTVQHAAPAEQWVITVVDDTTLKWRYVWLFSSARGNTSNILHSDEIRPQSYNKEHRVLIRPV